MPEPRSPPLAMTAALLAGLVLAGGCAQLEWHKDDSTAETREHDLAECTLQARSEALRLPAPQPSAPQVIIDPQGRVLTVHPPRQDHEHFFAEYHLLRTCLRARGYVLRERPPATP